MSLMETSSDPWSALQGSSRGALGSPLIVYLSLPPLNLKLGWSDSRDGFRKSSENLLILIWTISPGRLCTTTCRLQQAGGQAGRRAG
jgi:hypothetical protein